MNLQYFSCRISVIKRQSFVNSETSFGQQHIVIDVASRLLNDVFGNIGQHTRTPVGVN